jgi:hypothetical protein
MTLPHNRDLLGVGKGVLDEKSGRRRVLWALVCAAYHLERLADETLQLTEIRRLLSVYSAATVSLCFLRAAIAFDPPDTLEEAKALYEHYGVEATGLENIYPSQKPS